LNKVIHIQEKFEQIGELWHPHLLAELNGQQVKAARIKGEFVWHSHADADEMFLVVSGNLTIEMRDRQVQLSAGDMFVVPRGVEHRPVAHEETRILLFEPVGVINTGNTEDTLTRKDLPSI
jgi:mannose-6-phosphate isomerase-like protein (cupin superfamily)